MTDADDLTKFAAILDEFAAGQRQLALSQTAKQRLIHSRTIGRGGHNISFEAVVDQDAEAAEINALVDRMTEAGDRQEAKADLVEHLRQLRLEEATLAREKHAFGVKRQQMLADNELDNARKRQQIVDLTLKQRLELTQMQTSLREAEAQIAERRLTIEECRRVIAGQSRLAAIEETQRLRDAAERPAEAAD